MTRLAATPSPSPRIDTVALAPLTRSREARKETMQDGKIVLAEDEVARALVRIAHEIAERNTSSPAVALVGIHRRGAILARRLQALLEGLLRTDVPLGDLDIGFYRDDVASRPQAPVLHASHI